MQPTVWQTDGDSPGYDGSDPVVLDRTIEHARESGRAVAHLFDAGTGEHVRA